MYRYCMKGRFFTKSALKPWFVLHTGIKKGVISTPFNKILMPGLQVFIAFITLYFSHILLYFLLFFLFTDQ